MQCFEDATWPSATINISTGLQQHLQDMEAMGVAFRNHGEIHQRTVRRVWIATQRNHFANDLWRGILLAGNSQRISVCWRVLSVHVSSIINKELDSCSAAAMTQSWYSPAICAVWIRLQLQESF
mmetsp:Transcript_6283/g.10988  ORF Transcript_6283/g.10988 Transcript_6283/m.10988 type:complete len:124 (-) Transcript_6283:16-387(-)